MQNYNCPFLFPYKPGHCPRQQSHVADLWLRIVGHKQWQHCSSFLKQQTKLPVRGSSLSSFSVTISTMAHLLITKTAVLNCMLLGLCLSLVPLVAALDHTKQHQPEEIKGFCGWQCATNNDCVSPCPFCINGGLILPLCLRFLFHHIENAAQQKLAWSLTIGRACGAASATINALQEAATFVLVRTLCATTTQLEFFPIRCDSKVCNMNTSSCCVCSKKNKTKQKIGDSLCRGYINICLAKCFSNRQCGEPCPICGGDGKCRGTGF